MAKTQIDGIQVASKKKSRNPILEFDKLQMYFGYPYEIDLESANGKITVYQPTIGKIMKLGEKKFYSTLNVFVTNTTSYRLPLWESGMDWNEMSDYELFVMLFGSADADALKLIFGDLDMSKFTPNIKTIDGVESMTLYNADDDIEINEDVYHYICQYLRNVFNIFPDEKFAKNEPMKKAYIQKDKRVRQRQEEMNDQKDSSILPLISACVNHPGFKYNISELENLSVYAFYDSVKRLQLYENTTAVMKGMYSGFVDSSKIPADSYNFMKDI